LDRSLRLAANRLDALFALFDKDGTGTSNCYGECAKHWPPVTAASNAQGYGQMTLVSRTNGLRQWAYDGKPLYTYREDAMRGT
jgi:predicted lipoprotein with Yx(FWY)xxD motif